MMSPPLPKPNNPSRPSFTATGSTPAVTSPKPVKSTFDDLWTTSLTSLGTGAKANGAAGAGGAAGGKTIKDLENEKSMSSLWGPGRSESGTGKGQALAQSPAKAGFGGNGGGGGDDLLL